MKKLIENISSNLNYSFLNKINYYFNFIARDLGIADILIRVFFFFVFTFLLIHNIGILLDINLLIINWSKYDLILSDEMILQLEYNSGKLFIFLTALIFFYFNFIYSIFNYIDLESKYNTYKILEGHRLIDSYDLNQNKISSEKYDEIFANNLIKNSKHSSTMVYDENGRMGSKFVELISDGHWMTTIHDQRNNKFIVEHFRTWENLQNIEWQKRLDEEILLNNEKVFGFQDKENDYSRNNESHVFNNNKKQ